MNYLITNEKVMFLIYQKICSIKKYAAEALMHLLLFCISVRAFNNFLDFVSFLMSKIFRLLSFFYKLPNSFPVNLLSCLPENYV